MARISSCPGCCRQVSVPDAAGRADRVRCPLCAAEFPLTVIVEAALPELILLEVEEPAQPATAESTTGSSDIFSSASSVFGGPAGAPVPAAATQEEPTEGAIVLRAGGPDTETALPGEPITGVGEATVEGLAPTAEPAADSALPAVPFSESPLTESADAESPVHEGALTAVADHAEALPIVSSPGENGSVGEAPSIDAGLAAADAAEVDSVGIQARPHMRRPAPNMVVELFKVVLGGFLGLAVGYFVLLWVFKNDVLGLAESLPSWMVPAEIQE
jgi:hypothetical protein